MQSEASRFRFLSKLKSEMENESIIGKCLKTLKTVFYKAQYQFTFRSLTSEITS